MARHQKKCDSGWSRTALLNHSFCKHAIPPGSGGGSGEAGLEAIGKAAPRCLQRGRLLRSAKQVLWKVYFRCTKIVDLESQSPGAAGKQGKAEAKGAGLS